MQFNKASKKAARARVALIGPAGSGKTYTALAIGTRLGERVALIDSERGSASKYSSGKPFDFDTCALESFSPLTYVEAIELADAERYDVVIIDSLSHAWMGKDGALEQVDRAAKRSNSGNSFAAWRDVTPQHNQLVDAMLGCRAHVIVTMRTKTEYVIQENDRGKKEPKKIGLAPVQRDGLEYEFDVVGDLDLDNNLVIGKTRCSALKGALFHQAGEDVANILSGWLSDGSPVERSALEVFEERLAAALSAPEVKAIGDEIRAASSRLSKPALEKLRAAAAARLKVLERPADPNNDGRSAA